MIQGKKNINSFSKLISTDCADHHPSKRRTCFWQTFENDKLLCWQSFQQLHSAQCQQIWLNELNLLQRWCTAFLFFETRTHSLFYYLQWMRSVLAPLKQGRQCSIVTQALQNMQFESISANLINFGCFFDMKLLRLKLIFLMLDLKSTVSLILILSTELYMFCFIRQPFYW